MTDDNKAEALALIGEIVGAVKKVSTATVQIGKVSSSLPDIVAAAHARIASQAAAAPSPSPPQKPAAAAAAKPAADPVAEAKTASQQDVLAALLRKKKQD